MDKIEDGGSPEPARGGDFRVDSVDFQKDIEIGLEAELQRALPLYWSSTPDGETFRHLAHYLALVVAGNEKVRLVGDAAPGVLVRRHLGESLFLLTGAGPRAASPRDPFDARPGRGPLEPQPGPRVAQTGALSAKHVVDVGSGAGFPGLVLALAQPDIKTTLVESTRKKAEFLAAAVRELGVEARVSVVNAFLERRPTVAAGELRDVLAQADLVTVRALERMELAPGWLGRWLSAGTQVAFWATQARVAAWRIQWPQWTWGDFRLLPEAESRGIVLARWPG